MAAGGDGDGVPRGSGHGFRGGVLEEGIPLDAEERAVAKELLAGIEQAERPRVTDEQLVRYVRGFKNYKPRIPETIKALREHLEWRQTNEIDSILCRKLEDSDTFRKLWPCMLYGDDAQGHFVVAERISEIKLNALRELPVRTLVMCRAQEFEALQREKAHVTRRRGHGVYKHVSIIDLVGLSVSSFSNSKIRNVVKEVIGLGSSQYPETVWKIVISNAPAAFRMIWKVVKLWVHPETLEKIFIVGGKSEYEKTLDKIGIPPESRPTWLGGSNTGRSLRSLVEKASVESAPVERDGDVFKECVDRFGVCEICEQLKPAKLEDNAPALAGDGPAA